MSLTLYLCFVLWLATGYLKCIVTLKDEAYKNEPDWDHPDDETASVPPFPLLWLQRYAFLSLAHGEHVGISNLLLPGFSSRVPERLSPTPLSSFSVLPGFHLEDL